MRKNYIYFVSYVGYATPYSNAMSIGCDEFTRSSLITDIVDIYDIRDGLKNKKGWNELTIQNFILLRVKDVS